jgi:nicotinamide riboside transporter PnuC
LFISIGGIIQAKPQVESFVDSIIVVIGTIAAFLMIRKYMSVFSNLIYELMN